MGKVGLSLRRTAASRTSSRRSSHRGRGEGRRVPERTGRQRRPHLRQQHVDPRRRRARGEVQVGLVNPLLPRPATHRRPRSAGRQPLLPPATSAASSWWRAPRCWTPPASSQPQAEAFVEYLLSDVAQQYFVDTVKEYPIIDGIELPTGQPALADIGAPRRTSTSSVVCSRRR